MKMYKNLTVVALATLLSSPAWAQTPEAEEVQQEVSRELRGLEQDVRVAVEEAVNVDKMVMTEVRRELRELDRLKGELDTELDLNLWDDDDDDYRKRRRFRTEDSWNLEIGLNNFMTGVVSFPNPDEEYALDTWGSHYIAIARNYSTKLAGPLYIEYGASVSWYNYQFSDPRQRIVEGAPELTFERDSSTEIVPIRSKIRTPYVNVHFVPVLDLSKGTLDRSYQGKGFRIGLGGYAGYRIGGRAKYIYEVDGDKRKERPTGSYFQENFRYGVRGQVGFKGVDLFVNYDLNEVFVPGTGPRLNAVSFGLII